MLRHYKALMYLKKRLDSTEFKHGKLMMTILETENSQLSTALKQNYVKTYTKTLQIFRSKYSSIPQSIPE